MGALLGGSFVRSAAGGDTGTANLMKRTRSLISTDARGNTVSGAGDDELATLRSTLFAVGRSKGFAKKWKQKTTKTALYHFAFTARQLCLICNLEEEHRTLFSVAATGLSAQVTLPMEGGLQFEATPCCPLYLKGEILT